MAVKRKPKLRCSICSALGAEYIPCNYCKEKNSDKQMYTRHTLCKECFMLGCPVAYPREKKVLVVGAPPEYWLDVGEW